MGSADLPQVSPGLRLAPDCRRLGRADLRHEEGRAPGAPAV